MIHYRYYINRPQGVDLLWVSTSFEESLKTQFLHIYIFSSFQLKKTKTDVKMLKKSLKKAKKYFN